jgi:DNA polymerase/3'-5' exonuclease PolX
MEENNSIIENAKESICADTGMTMERLEELKNVGQNIMNYIKEVLRPVESNFERGFVLNMISEKCGYVSRLYIVDAMDFNANKDNETEPS